MASDSAYLMPTTVALYSLGVHNPHAEVRAFVLSEEIPDSACRQRIGNSLTSNVTLQWIKVDLSAYAHFRTVTHISKTAYARLLIPDILGREFTRVLYLDADILILGDIVPLWEVSLEGRALGAVSDIGGTRVGVQYYFNSGVLLMDLERWRDQKIAECATQYIADNPDSAQGDQDALNVSCNGKWKPLDEHWNFQRHSGVDITTLDRPPAILHFVMNHKPWNPGSLNPNRKLYSSYRQQTAFARNYMEIAADACHAGWSRWKHRIKTCVLAA